jgi:hypothetical protein
VTGKSQYSSRAAAIDEEVAAARDGKKEMRQ